MPKKIFITILISAICANVFSQNGRALNESEKEAFAHRMDVYSQQIQTLQCDFVQEKTSTLLAEKAVAKGNLIYQSPSMLRWEYTDPTPYTLIINGNDAVLLDSEGKKLGNERLLKQLGGIVISMINGDGITQNKMFSSVLFRMDSSHIRVVLSPLQKRLKDFYTNIELIIEADTMLANQITLEEISGDKMIIFLTNKVLNNDIIR